MYCLVYLYPSADGRERILKLILLTLPPRFGFLQQTTSTCPPQASRGSETSDRKLPSCLCTDPTGDASAAALRFARSASNLTMLWENVQHEGDCAKRDAVFEWNALAHDLTDMVDVTSTQAETHLSPSSPKTHRR
eukprot:295996-Hanusia_phi.AAC.1